MADPRVLFTIPGPDGKPIPVFAADGPAPAGSEPPSPAVESALLNKVASYATPDRQLFTLGDGTPVYATDGPNQQLQPLPPSATGLTPFPAQAATPSGYVPIPPPVNKDGSLKHETKEQKSIREAKNALAAQLNMNAGNLPFQMDLSKLRPQSAAESAAAQAAKKQAALLARNPAGNWAPNPRGEKTSGSGIDGVHVAAWEATRLRNQLTEERRQAELLFLGAGGREHSAGGSNLGEPVWEGEGGGSYHQGQARWITRSGTMLPNDTSLTIASVLETFNLYDGQ